MQGLTVESRKKARLFSGPLSQATNLVLVVAAALGVAAGAAWAVIVAVTLLLVALLALRWPAAVPYVWAAGAASIPYWVSTSYKGLGIMPATVLAVVCSISLLDRRLCLSAADIPFIALGVALTASALFWGSADGLIIVQWVPAYVLGRFVLGETSQRAAKALVVVLTGVAALAIVEFLLRWNPFVHVPAFNTQFEAWLAIDTRGGLNRAEWSLGHSIALGATLALAIPLLASVVDWTAWRKGAVLTVLLLGVLVTVSRGPLLAALVGVLLSVRLARSWHPQLKSTTRMLVVGVLLVSTLAAPMALRAARLGSEELQATSAHRASLFADTWHTARPFGVSPIADQGDDGRRWFGGYPSVENEFLFLALATGWVPALILFASMAFHFVRAVLGRAGPWETAVAAQLPLLLTVAFITQYQSFFWMAEGVCMAEIMARRSRGEVQAESAATADPAYAPNAS